MNVFYGLAAWSHGRAQPVPVILWGLAYGALIEIIQLFIPSRQCSPGDLLADAAGLAIGMIAWVLLKKGFSRIGLKSKQAQG